VLYILDEPSIGLHQRDNAKLIGTLERLRDLGNTVLVVEHDEQMMRAADHLVDMGPGAGEHGGHVVRRGAAKAVERNAKSITGSSSPASARSRSRSGAPRTWARSRSAGRRCTTSRTSTSSSRSGSLICVTGVSGSGKSTLVNEIVYKALANRLHRMRVKPGDHDASRASSASTR
jgi:excinuclease ABC subunit A